MKSIFHRQLLVRLAVCSIALVVPLCSVFSQDEEAGEKAKVRMDLTFFNNLSTGPYLQASVKTKVDRSYEPVEGENLTFYLVKEEDERIGQASTNEKGIAKLPLDKSLLSLDDSDFIHYFKVSLEGSDKFRDADSELEITEATMEVEFTGDSAFQISIKLTAFDSSGTLAPVPDAVVKPFVQRMFSLLPVGEEEFATDESGELVLDFPNDIPGDENGMLNVVVKLPDHELYGNLIYEKEIKWGIPVTDREVITDGELWAARANAPMWLVIFVNAILLGIWGTIFYIVSQLMKISKLSRAKN